jgi:hypothetical protein
MVVKQGGEGGEEKEMVNGVWWGNFWFSFWGGGGNFDLVCYCAVVKCVSKYLVLIKCVNTL